jgi:hypothetical protein
MSKNERKSVVTVSETLDKNAEKFDNVPAFKALERKLFRVAFSKE